MDPHLSDSRVEQIYMPIIETPIPGQVTATLRAGLADFLTPDDKYRVQLNKKAPGYPVVISSLSDVISGSVLENARSAGWGFVAGEFGHSPIAVLVNQLEGKPLAITSVYQGQDVEALMHAIRDAKALQAVSSHFYELWILKIPSILLEAVWLRSRSANSDLVIPFHTLSESLDPKRAYTAAEFRNAVQPIGETFRPFTDISDKRQAR
jgi:hypothetical protein